MACPYFLPTQRSGELLWPHPARLPLGDAWLGQCTAVSPVVAPTPEQLKDNCNLGYARNCPRLPQDRAYDAVRFCITSDRQDVVTLLWVCETGYRPAAHGSLTYSLKESAWLVRQDDARVQRMAECYLESYLNRRCSLDNTTEAVPETVLQGEPVS